MKASRSLALALALASPAFGQDDRAPLYDQFTGQRLPPLPSAATPSPQAARDAAPAPVQPVSTGTTVNSQVAPQAPTTVNIPGQTIQIQQGAPTILLVAAPAQTVNLTPASVPAVQYVVQQAPAPVQPLQAVTTTTATQPISVLKSPGPFHRMVGHMGAKMASFGQPYVKTINQSVQVQTVAAPPAPTVQYVVAQAPAPVQYMQAPAKASPQR